MEAHCDDGLIEIFGLKQGWHASFVMAQIITAKHIAQVQKTLYPRSCPRFSLGFILTGFINIFRRLRLGLN